MADYLDISNDLREKIKAHYMRSEIISEMLDASPNKEIVGSFGGVGYSKRPDILEYDNDITVLVKKGVTSFHISEEIWENPLSLAPGIDKKKLRGLRKGWDLIIDIDCPHWEICKSITHHLVQAIKRFDVKNVSVKFSGNKGFHIGIPQESFPDEFRKDFPEMPRKISAFLLNEIMDEAKEDVVRILEKDYGINYAEKLEEIFGKPKSVLLVNGEINPSEIVEVDTLLISQRHLYRMVYSVNEKSALISIPINPDKVLKFEKNIASIENNVYSRFKFLDRSLSIKNDAQRLCIEAIDSQADPKSFITKEMEVKKELTEAQREFEEMKEKIPEECFPETIKKLLEGGFSDGKKRAFFVLRNFLICVGWSSDEIKTRLDAWNSTHLEPIRDTIFKTQLNYADQMIKRNERMLPPNFSQINFYSDIIGELSEYKIAKNPLSLAIRRYNNYKKEITKNSKKNKRKKDSTKE